MTDRGALGGWHGIRDWWQRRRGSARRTQGLTGAAAVEPEHDWLLPPTGGLGNARWFAVDLHVPHREFGFLHLPETLLETSPFLDSHITAPWQQARFLGVACLPVLAHADERIGFLFHTSFCCSTLLAGALHLPPYSVALREPLVLRRLADARWQRFACPGLLPRALQLLGRPWHPGAAVLIKPTHVALGLAPEMAQAMPQARGIVLTSRLEDFLLSNLKKPPETQAKLPELVQRAMLDSAFSERLGPRAYPPPDFLSAVALQWCAQHELLGELLATDGGRERFRLLYDYELLADLEGSVLACVDWLGWSVPPAVLMERLARIRGRHAKLPTQAFDAAERDRQAKALRERFDAPIRAALAWAERVVFPAMTSGDAMMGSRMY